MPLPSSVLATVNAAPSVNGVVSTPTLPLLRTENNVVVAKAAVDDAILKRSEFVSLPTAAMESFAKGEVVPMPTLPVVVRVILLLAAPKSESAADTLLKYILVSLALLPSMTAVTLVCFRRRADSPAPEVTTSNI